MKYSVLVNREVLILLLIFSSLIGCRQVEKDVNEFNSDKTEVDWSSYFSEIGYEISELRNHIILVMHPSTCSSCVDELNWWNSQNSEDFGSHVSLILIERHETTLKSFKDNHNLQLPLFRDVNTDILRMELVPTTPVKVYFDMDGEIVTIMPMDSRNLVQFMDFIHG